MIYKKILDIQEELPAVLKGKEFIMNNKVMYRFRGIDDLYNAVNPLFKKHRVFMTPEIQESESTEKPSASGKVLFYEKMVIRYKLYAEDGSCVEASTKGIGMDSGDKAANKAMSVAQKYALIQIFSIPTDDPKDPEIDGHQVPANEVRKPELTPDNPKWAEAITFLRTDGATMERILKGWIVSKENQDKLQNDVL